MGFGKPYEQKTFTGTLNGLRLLASSQEEKNSGNFRKEPRKSTG
jgi:hypothetical protein